MRLGYGITGVKSIVTVGIDKTGGQEEVKVYLDQENQKLLKKFRCVGCGGVVFEYYGATRVIIAGAAEPEISAPVRIQCKSPDCKMMYDIESV